jgi:hypothetical protein
LAEEVIISISLEKGDNERQVDALTKKITDLTNANKGLHKANLELIKTGQQNSKEYVENTRQIEINKQKITEATASRKGLIQTILAEDNSIKALRVRNAELIKQRDQLSTSTEEGRKKIADINSEIDRNNKTINDNSSALEKQRFNIGNYKSALDGIVPGLGGFIDGIQGATKAGLAFIATPIGIVLAAVGAALFALTSYFKGSEEGQNNLNKVMAVGSAIMEQFMNVAEAAGKVIFDAISNPKQALIDFGNLVKENIINRFEGMLELIPNLGRAVTLLFEGKFAEAGELAFDSVAKVATGVENATSKIIGFVKETGALIEQGIKNGEIIAALNAKIDRDERALIVARAKSLVDVGKLREDAITQEGDVRRKTIKEAIALEQALSDKEVAFAKTKLALKQTELKANGDDKEALKELAQARADVFTAEATAFQNTLKFRKQLQALDEEDQKKFDDQLKVEIEREETRRKALNETEEVRLQLAVSRANGIQEEIDAEIELEKFKTSVLLQNREITEEQMNLIIAQARANREAIYSQADAKEKAAEKKLADEKKKIRADEQKGLAASLDAGIGLIKAAFGENKAVAIAETIVNTIRAVSRALADFPFPFSLIVGSLVGAAGAVQTAKLAGVKFAKGGLTTMRKLALMAAGGVARTGGVLAGPLHKDGGIPFTVGGRAGFEAEGGEAIINRRSAKMFKHELSAINQAGGGVAFSRGGVARYQTGSVIAASQTRQASQVAESRTAVRDIMETVMRSFPAIQVSVEDINERSSEVAQQTQKAYVTQ